MPRPPRVVAIMQARMGSSRLPAKSLAELQPGLTLVEAIMERVARTPNVDASVLATTTEAADDALEALARRRSWTIVRGSVEDVLARFHQAALASDADVIVRVTADDPFKDPAVVARAVTLALQDETLDYVSNTIKPTFPEGLDIEVVRRAALDRAFAEARLRSDREHVTPYIWRQPDRFRVRNFEHTTDLSRLRWTIDYPEDLAFARAVYDNLYPSNPAFTMDDILALLERSESVRALGTSFRRNQGYLDSLKAEQE